MQLKGQNSASVQANASLLSKSSIYFFQLKSEKSFEDIDIDATNVDEQFIKNLGMDHVKAWFMINHYSTLFAYKYIINTLRR